MKTTDSYLLDSSAWLAYYQSLSPRVRTLIDGDIIIHTSVITLLEIKRKLTREGIPQETINQLLDFIKDKSLIIDVTIPIAEQAADFAIKFKLHAIDAIIYSSTQVHQSILITGDLDFNNLPSVEIIQTKNQT